MYNISGPKIEITLSDGKFPEVSEGFKLNIKDWVGFHQVFYFEELGNVREKSISKDANYESSAKFW